MTSHINERRVKSENIYYINEIWHMFTDLKEQELPESNKVVTLNSDS